MAKLIDNNSNKSIEVIDLTCEEEDNNMSDNSSEELSVEQRLENEIAELRQLEQIFKPMYQIENEERCNCDEMPQGWRNIINIDCRICGSTHYINCQQLPLNIQQEQVFECIACRTSHLPKRVKKY